MNNSTNSNYFDLVLLMFNQYLFQDCKNHIQDLKALFKQNMATSGNKLIEDLLSGIETYTLDNIGMPFYDAVLSQGNLTPAEIADIKNRIIQYKMLTPEQIEPCRKQINNLLAKEYIDRANKMYQSQGDGVGFIDYIKNLNFKVTRVDSVTERFDQFDINSIIAENADGGVPSKFDWINNTFQPECCYPKRGLMCVSMPPGTGKTLFCMQECLNMCLNGYKCHYLCMGDMNQSDFIVRMAAQYTGLPFYEIKKDIKRAYESLNAAIGQNLFVKITSAGELTVDEYIDDVKDKDYDVLFIDYDSNFKSNVATDMMYLVYGDIYDKLSELSVKYNKLVFILAQPMKQSWSLSVIENDQIGESAKKIHVVDWCMTRAREPGNLNGLGTSKIVKSRRGEEQVVDYNIRLSNGRFKSLPKAVFQDLCMVQERKHWSEAEIDQMIAQYLQSRGAAQTQVNNRMKQMTGPSPFGKNP